MGLLEMTRHYNYPIRLVNSHHFIRVKLDSMDGEYMICLDKYGKKTIHKNFALITELPENNTGQRLSRAFDTLEQTIASVLAGKTGWDVLSEAASKL